MIIIIQKKYSVIHRDLAARNVLLTESLIPKISDFGMSRINLEDEDANKTTNNVGPIKVFQNNLNGTVPSQLHNIPLWYYFENLIIFHLHFPFLLNMKFFME